MLIALRMNSDLEENMIYGKNWIKDNSLCDFIFHDKDRKSVV